MPFVPPFFGKIGVSSKDLLSKKYDYDNEMKISTEAAGGWTLEATGTDAGGPLAGLTTLKYNNKSYGNVEGTFHTSGAPKDNKAKITLNKFYKGAEAIVNANPEAADLELKYKQDGAAVSAKVTSSMAVDASLSLGMEGVVLGGSVASKDLGSISDYSAGAQYSQSGFTGSILAKKQCSAVSVSLFQKYSKSFSWGTTMQLSNNAMDLGVEYAILPDTTVKAKASSSKMFALAMEYKVPDPQFKMNLAAEFDGSKQTVEAKKFGVGLVFGS